MHSRITFVVKKVKTSGEVVSSCLRYVAVSFLLNVFNNLEEGVGVDGASFPALSTVVVIFIVGLFCVGVVLLVLIDDVPSPVWEGKSAKTGQASTSHFLSGGGN